jgi:serine/threonine protein kinase
MLPNRCVCVAVCGVCSDLKSANCLLKSAARTPHDLRGFTVKIADFGSAHIIDNTVAAWTSPAVSKKGAVCTPLTEEPALATCDVACRGGAGDKDTGRPGVGVMPVCEASLSHAAPELVAGQLPSLAADTWSLGVILWELVTGEWQGAHHLGLSYCIALAGPLPFPLAHIYTIPCCYMACAICIQVNSRTVGSAAHSCSCPSCGWPQQQREQDQPMQLRLLCQQHAAIPT